MEVPKIFHMKGGQDDSSYALNSSFQKMGSEKIKHIMTEAIQAVYKSLISSGDTTFTMADMGCSSGPNTLSVVRDFYGAVESAGGGATEMVVHLNDLGTNDFNTVLKELPRLYEELGVGGCEEKPGLYVSATPGSFYGRVFPRASLHFVYSSYSLHWLSKIPDDIYDENGDSKNKGSIYITKITPPSVIQAYESQFRVDFISFLQLRSKELVSNGRMVLLFLGRQNPTHIDRGQSFLWELLTRSFAIMVSRGLVDQQKVDSYEIHFYAPSKEEVEDVIREEGSFMIEQLQMFCFERKKRHEVNGVSHGTTVARAIKAVQESMLSHHFGKGPMIDELFETYATLVDEETAKEAIRPITFVISLAKKYHD